MMKKTMGKARRARPVGATTDGRMEEESGGRRAKRIGVITYLMGNKCDVDVHAHV